MKLREFDNFDVVLRSGMEEVEGCVGFLRDIHETKKLIEISLKLCEIYDAIQEAWKEADKWENQQQ